MIDLGPIKPGNNQASGRTGSIVTAQKNTCYQTGIIHTFKLGKYFSFLV
jgi:hypothetical protein